VISKGFDTETQALLEVISASPVPLYKTALIRRSQRTGIHLLDSRLRRLVNLSLIEELTRDSAGWLGADVRHKVPNTRYYRARPEYHNCHFCGESVAGGFTVRAQQRHWLSDCRPDLVKHEPGLTCTWGYIRDLYEGPHQPHKLCYAYQADDLGRTWTNDHAHFYEDGPM
jgi:hypothetical protein